MNKFIEVKAAILNAYMIPQLLFYFTAHFICHLPFAVLQSVSYEDERSISEIKQDLA
jgi:hypothetical protein